MQENRRRAVLMKLIERGFKTQRELAQAAKLSELSLSRNLTKSMTIETLVKLDRVLRFSDAELARVVRGK